MSGNVLVSERVSLKTKIAYGCIEFSNTLGMVLFTSFGMYFLTDVAGIAPGIAGSITAVATLINALVGPLFGVMSDSCKSKYGRRRPFIAAAAVPTGIIVWLLFTDFGLDGIAKVIYFFVMVTFLYAVLCLLDVPYTSLGAEITKDYDERSSLNFWRSLFCQISSIIAGAFPISIAAAIGSAMNDQAKGWSVMALIFGVASTVMILIGWRGTRGQEKHREDNEKFTLKDSLSTFKNKSFLYVVGLYSAGIAAYSIGLMVNVYYMTSYVKMSENQVTLALVIFNIAAVCWLPLIPVVSKKFSKKVSWVVFFSIWAMSIILIYICVNPGDIVKMYILSALGGAGSMVAYTVGWSMLPDCIEVDELATGQRREGLYYGILTIVQKGSAALVIFIGGLLLELIGYDETVAIQSTATNLGLKNIYAWVTVFFILLSFVFVALYPITREKHSRILKAIEQRKAGKEPETEGIEEFIIK